MLSVRFENKQFILSIIIVCRSRCDISTSHLDKTASYECSQRAQNRSCILNGGTGVLEYTTATFSCKPGYHLVQNQTQKWICLERSWSPKLPKCDSEFLKLKYRI